MKIIILLPGVKSTGQILYKEKLSPVALIRSHFLFLFVINRGHLHYERKLLIKKKEEEEKFFYVNNGPTGWISYAV